VVQNQQGNNKRVYTSRLFTTYNYKDDRHKQQKLWNESSNSDGNQFHQYQESTIC
jgi:hypothetical protein